MTSAISLQVAVKAARSTSKVMGSSWERGEVLGGTWGSFAWVRWGIAGGGSLRGPLAAA